ncbi:hypothetical protein FW778_14190 [Ginsengibacter hankyongi]|uniref:Uncharacterized protein n=1 Tax=Ginsengibacter hankyongi TaxID=2607284 RepID=A0A5J5IFR3_9BACT|nr:hypothetical protein [Ginsengibacter hankyongi]KAA9038693.1 hypothetical protein FW778_14190 [Ginsengibacter hankyongi]
MKLFKRKKDKELYPFISRFLIRLNQKLLTCANYLQQRTNNFSRRKRILLLFVICLVFVTESAVVVVKSLQRDDSVLITVAPIRLIAPTPRSHTFFPGNEYKRIEQFKQLLNSNKNFRDSILAARPYLMDTLNYLQKIYKQHEK